MKNLYLCNSNVPSALNKVYSLKFIVYSQLNKLRVERELRKIAYGLQLTA